YAHFDYFPFFLGDKMVREPRISAFATCNGIHLSSALLRTKFTKTEWDLYQKIWLQHAAESNRKNDATLRSSSVGRIFDAVSSLLNICDKQSFEGQAAMLLEEQASRYIKLHGRQMLQGYFEAGHYNYIPTTVLMNGIVKDIQQGKSVSYVAAKFHFSLVQIIDMVAEDIGVNKITFSGGVFLNGVLVDLLRYHLSGKYQLYFHKELSPNDENISFGQMVYYDNKIAGVNKMERSLESLSDRGSLGEFSKRLKPDN
ncbi:MAG: hypothetical protein ABIO76_05640, partial [Ginsengibacter sp.]